MKKRTTIDGKQLAYASIEMRVFLKPALIPSKFCQHCVRSCIQCGHTFGQNPLFRLSDLYFKTLSLVNSQETPRQNTAEYQGCSVHERFAGYVTSSGNSGFQIPRCGEWEEAEASEEFSEEDILPHAHETGRRRSAEITPAAGPHGERVFDIPVKAISQCALAVPRFVSYNCGSTFTAQKEPPFRPEAHFCTIPVPPCK